MKTTFYSRINTIRGAASFGRNNLIAKTDFPHLLRKGDKVFLSNYVCALYVEDAQICVYDNSQIVYLDITYEDSIDFLT